MIRERVIQSATYAAGTSQVLDLPRDACYHILQLSWTGSVNLSQPSGATTGVTLDDCFPYSLLKNIRLLRNGSDVVYQSNGCLLAREHYYLNERWPHARLYTLALSVETLLTGTSKGVTVPANDEGIGMTQLQFVAPTGVSGSPVVNFDFQVDMYLQMGPEDLYYTTIVDARRLATYQLIFDYANVADVTIAGTNQTVSSISATGRIDSYDQDNLATDIDFGTFKRSQLQLSNIPYGTSNFQVLLPRGNYFHGVIIDQLAQKANSTTVLQHENAVISSLINRINSNFQLRNTNWEDLQRKNVADGCANNAFSGSRGLPNGAAYLYYPVTGDKANELVPSHVMDQFDLFLTLSGSTTSSAAPGTSTGINNPENGATTSGTNPVINFMLEEVIPGVSMGESYPTAAMAGSKRATSAKPYAK